MSWFGRGLLLAFMALAIASPAGVAKCGGEYDPFKDEPKQSPTVVPWTPHSWGGSWAVPNNCTTCHG